MKILYVTLSPIHFNTSATIRNRALMKGLNELGHQIDLLTIEAPKNRQYLDSSFDDSYIQSISYLPASSAYQAIKPKEASKSNLKSRLFKVLRFVYYKLTIHDYTITIAKKANCSYLQSKDYDLVISSSDPKSSHVAVSKLIKSGLKHHRWIQFWGDPLTLDITNDVIYPRWLLKQMEKRIIVNADKVVYVSPFTYQGQKELFNQFKSRLSFVPIPYLKPKNYDLSFNRYHFGYFGDYYASIRNIQTFFTCAASKGFSSVIAGNSDISIVLKGVSVLPRVSSAKVEELEAESEVLVCVLNKKGTQLPGKIYHYAATNKPIVIVIDGEYSAKMIEYLQGFNRFMLVNNDADSISTFMDQKPWLRQQFIPSSELSPIEVAKQFLK